MMDSYPYDLVIGLDRSDRKADIYTIDVRNHQHHKQTLEIAPEGLLEWVDELRQSCPQGKIAICLEQPASNLLVFLESYEFITLYAINPITLQKYREAFVTSRAKDDQIDAEFLADLLLTHLNKLTPWQPEDPQTRLLGQLVLHRRGVVDERTGLTNRLQALLKQYFPQALVLAGDELWRPVATAFLGKWPTLQAVKKARPETLKKFYYLQGSRSEKLIAKRLELVDRAVPLCDQEVLLEVYASRIRLIV